MITVLIFLLNVIIANIIIGYIVAMMYGVGPPQLKDAFRLFTLDLKNGILQEWMAKSLKWELVTRYLTDWIALISSFLHFRRVNPEQSDEVIAQNIDEKIRDISSLEVKELLDDQAEAITQVSPVQELFDDNLMSIVFEQGIETWLVADKSVEMSIMQLNTVMMENGYHANILDRKLRSIRVNALEKASEGEIRKFLSMFEADCKNYLEAQSNIKSEINEQIGQFGELDWLAEKIEFANMEQASQIETTLNNLKVIDVNQDPEMVCERLIDELASLRRARHQLHDVQEDSFIAMLRYEDKMDTVNLQTQGFDKITGLENRIAFMHHLWKWWQQKRHEKNKLTFALYDIVGFGQINDRIGIENSDNLLKYLANMIYEKIDGRDFVGVYRGNCLISVSQNIGMRKVVASVEKIRQELGWLRFECADQIDPIEMKVTCAVIDYGANTTELQILQSLDETLAAAKTYGGNVTFQMDNSVLNPHPMEVESPDFGFHESMVRLSEQTMVPVEPQFDNKPECDLNALEMQLAEPI